MISCFEFPDVTEIKHVTMFDNSEHIIMFYAFSINITAIIMIIDLFLPIIAQKKHDSSYMYLAIGKRYQDHKHNIVLS